MTKPARAAAVLVALLSFPASPIRAQSALEGEWTGGYQHDGEWQWIQVRFEADGEPRARVSIPEQGRMNVPATDLAVHGPRVRFEVSTPDSPRVFEGMLEGDSALVGRYRHGEERGPFRLLRVRAVDPTSLHRYTGTYQLGHGRVLYLFVGEIGGKPELTYVDHGSGRIGRLLARSGDTFFAGPAILKDFPVDVEVAFEKDSQGNISGLFWNSGDKPREYAPKVKLWDREEVRFQSGDITLEGTLFKPLSPGPHPAVILVQGSGPVDRQFYTLQAEYLARHGIAALAYDKRGTGKSGGTHATATFEQLAGDVLAAVGMLRGHSDIRASQIGLHGTSQGGWVAPLAASRSEDVAFISMQGGPGVTPGEQEIYRMSSWLRASEVPEETIQTVMRAWRLAFEFASTGEGAHELDAAVEAARVATAGMRVGVPSAPVALPSPSTDTRKRWYHSLDPAHDPVPVLRKVSVPVLAVFGEFEEMVPIQASIENMRRALQEGGNPDFWVAVLPRAYHGMSVGETGNVTTDMFRMSHLAPGYMDLIRQWILSQVESDRVR